MLTDEQRRFLAEHRWCLLTTVRRDGRPQVSMLAYALGDDGTILLSARAASAKVRNARRRADVVVTIADDRRFLALDGSVEVVADDPRRAVLTRAVQDSLLPADAAVLQREFDAGLDVTGRVVLVISPRSAVGRV
ncbi:MAG: pyridoxamine 5'-phosphate oxidase family protein [Acidimicrobiales bacterium]